ncbi:MAG: 50S ribosomal protein L18 [Nitrososphaerales archaeon]
MGHIPLLKRRREGKTNYRKRKALLISKKNFSTIRISDENVLVQIAQVHTKGDKVLVSANSKELKDYGWKGSNKSSPACYLVGLLAALKAKKIKVREVVPYLGLRRFIKGGRISCVLKGLMDGGLSLSIDKEALPEISRVKGEHIQAYAKELKKKDELIYSKKFSKLLERGLKPEDYPQHFDKVKEEILGRFKE